LIANGHEGIKNLPFLLSARLPIMLRCDSHDCVEHLKEGLTMMKTANRMILAATAASVAMLPIAAQASTRAGDNGSVYSTSAPGLKAARALCSR
jgi:hypothetical protein